MDLLILDNVSFLGQVNTIKKLADILALDKARLVDESRASANRLNVIARKHKLVLHILTPLDRDSRVKIDGTNDLEGE